MWNIQASQYRAGLLKAQPQGTEPLARAVLSLTETDGQRINTQFLDTFLMETLN